MTRARVQSLFALLAAVAFLAPSGASAAEIKFRLVMYATKADIKPVGDVEGHVAGTWERRGLCIMGKDIGAYLGNGTLDMTKGKGTAEGKNTCTFDGGSSWTGKFQFGLEPLGNGLLRFKNVRSEFVEGTGRFEGMKGTYTWTGRTYTPSNETTKGDAIIDAVGTYNVAKKKPVSQK